MKKQAVFQIVNTEYEWLTHIKIDPEYSQLVPELSEEEYTRLKESIASVGLYEPIIINQEGTLLDGHHRLKVVKDLGWSRVNVETKHFENRTDEEIYVIESNVIRRQLSDYQKTVLAMKLEPMYAEKARQRQGTRTDLDETLSSNELEVGQARDQAAKAVGLTPTTYHRAKTVLQEANKQELDLFKTGKIKPYTLYKNIDIRKKKAKLNKEIENISPLEGEFDTIVIDPAWEMGEYNQAAFRGGTPYPTMTLDEIKNIKIPSKENCVLWLWTTNKFLHEAFHVLEYWGFEYKACLTWAKDKMGVGVWLRGQTEHCLLAVKGHPLWELKGQTTCLIADNKGHSIKPDEFYDLVDSLCYGRKLDYFAREPRDGWITYGTMERSK